MSSRSSFVAVIGPGGGAIPPVMALAQGLHRRGHRVSIVTDEARKPQVDAVGLHSIVVPENHKLELFLGQEHRRQWAAVLEREGTLDHLSNPFMDWATDALPFVLDSVRQTGPEALISSLFTPGLTSVLAQSLNIPWCFVNPAYTTDAGSPRAISEDYGNAVSVHIHGEWRRRITDQADLILHATDCEYDPVTDEYPENHHHVGPLHPDVSTPEPTYLSEPGPPWALVSVATGAQPGELAIVSAALGALAKRDLRVLATVPGRASEIDNRPANARVVDFAPHEHVLSHSKLAISHAGHGLVMRALGAGVPMVLVPWGRDQPGVAFRAKQLGVAEIIEPSDLSPETMSAAIDRVLSSDAIARKSREVAERMAKDDPIARAVELIERVAGIK